MRQFFVLILLALVPGTGCIGLKQSPFDSSNGGYAGAALLLLTTNTSRFVAFTNSTTIFESTDGITWTSRTITGASVISDAAITGTTVFGLDSGTNNLRRSTDGGRTWSSVSVAAVTLGKVGACGPSVVAATSSGASYTAYHSSNTGSTFASSTIDASSAIVPRNILCSDSQRFLSASNVGGASVHYSSNGGATWSASSGALAGTHLGLRAASTRAVAVYPATNPYVALSTDYGVSFGGGDSGTLSTLSNGSIQGAMGDDGTRFHLGFYNSPSCHFFRSTTGANSSWTSTSVACPATSSLVTLASGGSVLLAGGGTGAPLILRSADAGATWAQVTLPSSTASITRIIYVP